jgi:hypothetical protein
LNIRTKHTIAKDRLIIAKQRLLEAESRKSANNLQLLTFEQKQLEKKLALLRDPLHSTLINERTSEARARSTSIVAYCDERRSISWNGRCASTDRRVSFVLNTNNQQRLTLPRIENIQRRRCSTYSDGDSSTLSGDVDDDIDDLKSNIKYKFERRSPQFLSEKNIFDNVNDKQRRLSPPLLAIIPPDEDRFQLLT